MNSLLVAFYDSARSFMSSLFSNSGRINFFTIISFETKSKLNREKMKKIAGKQKGKSLR